ncbi:MAG: hypothetical protein JWP91_2769 [Fibrobacteres bacterium]|nr:hypothetical protein [Fibrobacterota bacterium]
MFLLREPFWLIFMTACLGVLFGRMKGRPGWGFLLGLFFGPLGLAFVLLMPARGFQRPQSGGGGAPRSGKACPRCSKSVGRADKACPHCGNLLVPIRYRVRGPDTA